MNFHIFDGLDFWCRAYFCNVSSGVGSVLLGKEEERKFMKARDVVAAVDLNLHSSTVLQSAFPPGNIFRDIG